MSKITSLLSNLNALFKPSDETRANNSIVKLTTFGSGSEWLRNIFSLSFSSENKTMKGDVPDLVCTVPKPADNDPHKIRDQIMQSMGYEKSDIEAFDAASGDKGFYIFSDKHPTEWANAGDVARWETKNGNIEINVKGATVTNLKNFLTERTQEKARITQQVKAATVLIDNPELRQKVSTELTDLLRNVGQCKNSASLDLMNTAAGADANGRAQIQTVLQRLQEKPEHAQNASLKIAQAHITWKGDQVKSGPAIDSLSKTMAEEAANMIKEFDAAKGYPQKPADINRREAAFVNDQAARLFRELGEDEKAVDFERRASYYKTLPQESAVIKEDSLIKPVLQRTQPGVYEMRPPTKAEREKDNFEKDVNAVRDMWGKTDKIGSPVEDKSTPDEGETVSVKGIGAVTRSRPKHQNPEKMKVKTTWEPIEMNRGRPDIKAGSGVLDLIITAGKWKTSGDRMTQIGEWAKEREILTNKIKAENVYPVPPRPEKIESVVADVHNQIELTTDPKEKAKLQETEKRLLLVLEDSYAFWGHAKK